MGGDSHEVPLRLSAVVSGGTPPYRVSWDFGDGTSAVGISFVHNYSSVGAACYNGSVTVSDSHNGHSTATFSFDASADAFSSRSGGDPAGAVPYDNLPDC